MAYQEQLADRLRIALDPALPLEERRMFGGLIFLFAGRMLCGTSGEDFMFRVGAVKKRQASPERGPFDWGIARPCRVLSGCRHRTWPARPSIAGCTGASRTSKRSIRHKKGRPEAPYPFFDF